MSIYRIQLKSIVEIFLLIPTFYLWYIIVTMMLYDFKNYKDYLKSVFTTKGQGRGIRSKVAECLRCQTGFISQVLNGKSHFSFEHCIKISSFLNHNKDEKHFFMLLVQKDRAGTDDLKDYFLCQINDILKKREEIKSRIKVDGKLNEHDYFQYYRFWYYAAIHVLISIPQYQSKEAICKKLNLSTETVTTALEFLVDRGLAIEKVGKYSIGKSRVHLPRESPIIFNHHTNWRLEAIKSFDDNRIDNLHYSAVISISKADAKKIKKLLIDAIEKVEPILIPSPEEEIHSICVDFFELGHR